jgi:uncharacterized repeat protein (TIGR01451 family)
MVWHGNFRQDVYMKISRLYQNKKTRAQAMVEFALVLPILLLLLYGLLETGRYLFIYASTITAARQAVRYGSATGNNEAGIPFYNDCDGIIAAARRVGFINIFEDINISYDGGLDDTNGNPIALNPNQACGTFTPAGNADRIIVEVTAQWSPIVPLVPLKPFLIRSTSERTILSSVSIFSDELGPGDWQNPNNGILTLSITPSSATYSQLGETITYTYTLKNTGLGALSEPFVVTSNIAPTSCLPAPATLASSASFTCTGTYTITQADLDGGTVTNTASATANGSPSKVVDNVITAVQLPELTLNKVPSPDAASIVGTNITYTYTLTNSGNVTLYPPYSVTDNKIASGNINCSGASNPLAPNNSLECFASYDLTLADVNNKFLINQAEATATYNSNTITSNSVTATVITTPLALVVRSSIAEATTPGETITYTYKIINNSESPVNSPSVSDRITVTCPAGSISAGSFITCTGTYIVTQADFDSGATLINTATATGDNGETLVSNTAEVRVPVTQKPDLLADINITPNVTTVSLDAVITYGFTLKNTGNLTLSNISVTDNKSAAITCLATTLLPNAQTTCTGSPYTVSANDILAGSINNKGTVTATHSKGTLQVTTGTLTVATFNGGRWTLSVTQDKSTVTPADPTIKYTYTLTNTGGIELAKPYNITSNLNTTLLIEGTGGSNSTVSITPDCNLATNSILPGETTTCTYTYVHPTTTGSATIVNNTTTANVGGTPAPLPAPLTAIVYSCTATNFTVSALDQGNGANRYKVTWEIDNKVGIDLPISNVSVNWLPSFNWELSSLTLDNGSTLDTPVLPDRAGPYTSGIGNLKGSLSTKDTVTTITFLFAQKVNPNAPKPTDTPTNTPIPTSTPTATATPLVWPTATATPVTTSFSASITIAAPYGSCSRSRY